MSYSLHLSRKTKLSFFLFFVCLLNAFPQVIADCGGVLDNGVGNWVVGANCTVNNGIYSAWGNTTVGPYTVTVASDAALIVNLTSNTVTFSSGKMLFVGNGVMYGKTSEFTWYNPGTTGTAVTGGSYTTCPAGTNAWNPITKAFVSGTVIKASRTGWIICK